MTSRGSDGLARRVDTLEAVDRRRTSLWTVAGLFILAASAALAVSMTDGLQGLPGNPPLRWALLGLGAAFILYVVEQERLLRHMTRALMRAEVLAASLQERIRDLTTLSRVGRLVNSVLTIDDVLEILLDAVTELTGAHRASVLFVEGDDLELVAGVGDGLPAPGARQPADGIAGWVVRRHEPVLVQGRASTDQYPGARDRADEPGSSVCAPLMVDGELIGVLSVERPPEQEAFTEVEMRSVAIFADQAATAVMNARRYEAERERVERLADALERRSELVAMMAHELKTPLTSILGMAHVLSTRASKLTDEKRQDMTETVRDQAERLRDMMDELLQVASADAGADLARERLDMEAIVRSGIEAAQALAVVREESSRPTELTIGRDLPAPWGDPEAMRRVLANLCENAVKYSPPGTPIGIHLDEVPGHVRVRVVDRGQGIPPEEQATVFERFRRTPDRRSGGVGLGLYIVRSLVTAHGGEVAVDSVEGHGSTFTITLPVRTRVVEAPVPQPLSALEA